MLIDPFEFAPLWTPEQIAKVLWLDASDASTITESGGSVSQWDDKSGEDNHVSQATGSKQPTTGSRTQNGLNVLDFDNASGDTLRNTSPSGLSLSDIDIFALVKRDDVDQNERYVLTLNGSGTAQIRCNRFSEYSVEVVSDTGIIKGGTYTSGDADPHIANYRYDGASVDLLLDGASVITPDEQTGDLTLDAFINVCSNAFAGGTLDGWLGEMVVCAHLSAEDREKMEGYLAWKWGLQAKLASAHQYKSNPPREY